ncbi:MAG: hypothetical protein IT422_26285 [Pirellulaceae bacterium]|nr:hypothetical protein [Pirellulaceae bacterium]
MRLIVTVYPTCPTTSDVLLALLQLQTSHASLEVRIVTCELWSGPENTVACYKANDSVPTVLFGSSASFEDVSDEPNHLTLAFSPEPILAAEWQKWFDVKWLKAARLTEQRAIIPALVIPEGTVEAAQKWAAYEQLCVDEQDGEELVKVTVDPVTGEVTAIAADGTPVTTVSTDYKLPKASPVYRKLAQLLDMGHLVSVDKTTRLAPFEVPVKPKWFGLETLKQIGSVKRQVSYRISALTEDELKQLENRRKKTGELLHLFSFSLADSQWWMPKSAEELFRQENSRVNTEAAGILSKLIAGDLNKFMDGRRKAVGEDANRMYRDLFPDKKLSDDALDEIMDTLKKRFEGAQQRSFLPDLSFTRISLPQPQNDTWKSQLGSSLHLLISIVRYPRKACRNGRYFSQGMSAKPRDILKAMNVLNDPFVEAFDRFEAQERAEKELEEVDSIEAADHTAEEKCLKLFELLGHKIAANADQAMGDAEGHDS